MATTNNIAQEVQFKEVKKYLAYFQKQVEMPENYHFRDVKKVTPNGVSAFLFRYEKDENKGLSGEHFSFIVTEKTFEILGYTFMDKRFSNLEMLSRTETEKIARDFLKKTDAELDKNLQNLWIERHDEQIIIDNETRTTIAGMKYKCYRPAHDDYAWIIVGFDGKIITFERDIKWNITEKRRITDKWLHDSWQLENNAKS